MSVNARAAKSPQLMRGPLGSRTEISTPMLMRFVIGTRDPSSQVEAGLFAAAYKLRDAERLPDYDQTRLRELLAWFAEHLVIPAPLSDVPERDKRPRAISWSKSQAKEHIQRARELASLLEQYDVRVTTVTTQRPGYVVYEDEHQLVAEPFGETLP